MVQNILKFFFGTQHERNLKPLIPVLHKINEKETWAMNLSEKDFVIQTEKFRKKYLETKSLDDILPEAFALVREAARRVLGERLYDVQLLGGIVLHQGKIMEMKTGEGKTLSSVTAAYLNAIPGKGVHIVTVNDYLAERDAEWMKPVYSYLGISVGSILANMDNEARKKAYAKDITYGTNNEFGFDYLRSNMRWSSDEIAQKTHNYCIIDEIDSILIDESRTPLIISGPADDDTAKFRQVNRLVGGLTECEKDPENGEYPENPVGDYKIEEKSKRITFTDEGMNKIESILQNNRIINGSLFEEEHFEYIHYFTQALKAHKLFQIDVDYVVQDGSVQIVDEFTGRILQGRRYSDGLHQAIEAKENIKVAQRNRTLATITFQNFFRMYKKISGMTGTADTEAVEFSKIYNLEVIVIPTNRPLAREDVDDVVYLNEKFKFEAICDEIKNTQEKGQPMLVGTVSIEKSELLSKMLTKNGIRHEVLNAKNHSREALIIAEAGSKGSVTIATNMAGRGTDIKLGGNPEFRARKKCGTNASDEEFRKACQEELLRWEKDRDEVKNLGGLYILGTERHESRRIDNQLRGRSGRQGDPGKSRFFISLDDSLMRLFGGDSLKSLMGKMGMNSGEPLFHPWINKSIERAQKKVEERNFEMRKHLLDFDDVLNEQRNFIYSQRDNILNDKDLKQRIIQAAGDIVLELVENYSSSQEDPETAYQVLCSELKESFFYVLSVSLEDIRPMSVDEIIKIINTDIENDIYNKCNLVGEEQFNLFIRSEYLRSVDSKWQDHLENLESLREAVYLRQIGQKNPLLEYKLEGFQIFDKLIKELRTSIAKKVCKVRIQKRDDYLQSGYSRQSEIESHNLPDQFTFGGGGQKRDESAPQARPEHAQITRSQPKIGRNDPCHCGSGKKYKHCHGR